MHNALSLPCMPLSIRYILVASHMVHHRMSATPSGCGLDHRIRDWSLPLREREHSFIRPRPRMLLLQPRQGGEAERRGLFRLYVQSQPRIRHGGFGSPEPLSSVPELHNRMAEPISLSLAAFLAFYRVTLYCWSDLPFASAPSVRRPVTVQSHWLRVCVSIGSALGVAVAFATRLWLYRGFRAAGPRPSARVTIGATLALTRPTPSDLSAGYTSSFACSSLSTTYRSPIIACIGLPIHPDPSTSHPTTATGPQTEPSCLPIRFRGTKCRRRRTKSGGMPYACESQRGLFCERE